MRKVVVGVFCIWIAIAGAVYVAAYLGITSVKEAKMPADARANLYLPPFPRLSEIHRKADDQ